MYIDGFWLLILVTALGILVGVGAGMGTAAYLLYREEQEKKVGQELRDPGESNQSRERDPWETPRIKAQLDNLLAYDGTDSGQRPLPEEGEG